MNDKLSKEFLQSYMYEHIPVAEFMQLKVIQWDSTGSVIEGPLSANKNDKKMAFGGSLSTMATLACWANVFRLCFEKNWNADVLIRKSEARFLQPGRSDLTAKAKRPPQSALEKFIKTYERMGKARIDLTSTVLSNTEEVLTFTGQFAVMKKQGNSSLFANGQNQ